MKQDFNRNEFEHAVAFIKEQMALYPTGWTKEYNTEESIRFRLEHAVKQALVEYCYSCHSMGVRVFKVTDKHFRLKIERDRSR